MKKNYFSKKIIYLSFCVLLLPINASQANGAVKFMPTISLNSHSPIHGNEINLPFAAPTSENFDDITVGTAETSPADAFITTWRTTTANESITIPVNSFVTGYNYTVDWGDGNISSNQTDNATHTYATAGTHTVSITGDFPAIEFGSFASDDANDAKLLTIEQWGTQVWQSMESAFKGAINLQGNATDVPDLSNVTDMSGMFQNATSFNQDISSWNVSKAENMSWMFEGATSFNGNLDGWNPGNVTDMSYMFKDATAFNKDISSWQTANVTDMAHMFESATSFNQDLNGWDVSKVESMNMMFKGATSFDGNLGGWNTENVTEMSYMFSDAKAFNQDLNSWNVSKVTNMTDMFEGAISFNQDLSSWNVSKVTKMLGMFEGATAFNGSLDGWNTGSVTNMQAMFKDATAFNQDLSGWDVSKVENMHWMFTNASSFNQDLSNWDISKVTDMVWMLDNSGLSTANYDSTLTGWAAQNVQANVTLGAGGLTYCAADSARQALIDNHGWTITGDSKDPNCTVSSAAPVISNLDGDADTFTEGEVYPILLDAGSNATLTDSDSPDFNGGNLTASITGNRAPGEDQIGVYVKGPITLPGGGILEFNGNPIGTITAGTGTNDFVVNFTTSYATPAAVQALIRALSYYNTNRTDPSTATRTIAITVNDGDGQTSAVSNVTVTLTGVNDPPTLSATGSTATFTEGQGPTSSLFSNVSINTVESSQGIKKFNLTVSNVNDGADEALNIGGVQVTLTNGNTGTIGAFTGFSVTLIGSTASVELYPTVPAIPVSELTNLLNNLTYENSSTNPTLATRTIELTSIQDDGGTSNGGVDITTLSISATVKVVGVNATPVITSNGGGSTASVSIAENTTTVTTIKAMDADAGTTLVYSLSGGADQGLFSINGSSGVLAFKDKPDFENPADADGDNNYEVTVRASDGTNTDDQVITVAVTDVNDNTPVITSNGGGSTASVSIAENTTAVTTVTARDADAGTILTYSLIGGADQGLFSIDGSSGALAFKAKPDFENSADADGDNNYEVTVRASDGTHTVDQTITVAVTNLNDNTPVISSNGGGSTASVSIAENTTAVTTVTARDADAGTTLVYSLSGGADQGLFSINGSSGALAFKAKPDFENSADADGDNNYEVTVRASDGTHTVDQTITVAVTNVNDNTPVISSNGGGSAASVSIAENTTAVTTVTARDADVGTTLTYSLIGGADQALFTINGTTGVLIFTSAPDFENPADADGDNNYEVTVRASDGTHTVDQTITVAVTNLNDNTPVISSNGGGSTASVSIAENTTTVTTIKAMDADAGTTLVYSLSGGADQGLFSINGSSGVLAFKDKPDFENPADADGDNNYEVTVRASDGTNTDEQAITVSITDVSEEFSIFIAIPNMDTISLTVYSGDTFDQVKQQIRDSTGIPPIKQQLSFSGQVLEDGRTLADYNIRQDDTLDLTVIIVTKITQQPKDTTVCPAASPSFVVAATGTNLSYQWQNSTDEGANWGNISGETATSLSLSNVQPSDSGTQYRVIVVGTLGSDTSSVATLRVHLPAQVIEAPRDTTVVWNETAQFKVVTSGEVTGYQWQSSSDGSTWNNMTGETSATLSLQQVQLSDSGMLYRVIISSPCAAFTTPPVTLTVKQAAITGITFADDTFTYDGTPKSLQISGSLPAGASVSYTNNGKTDVGQYSVTANLEGGNNYRDTTLNATLTISQSTFTGITFADGTFTYNGTPKSLQISGNLPAGASVSYTNNGKTDAGQYSVTANLEGGNNYRDTTLTATLTISQSTFTGITFTDGTFTYDGTPKSLQISGNLPVGTSVSYTNNGKTDAGQYSVTANLEGGNNYKDTTLTATLTISQSTFTGITFADGTFTYDGTPKSLQISGNLPAGASVSYTNNGKTDAGQYSVTANLEGGNNYRDTTLTATLTIKQAPQSISFGSLPTKKLSDGNFQLQATASSGLAVVYTYSYISTSPAATVSPTGYVTVKHSGSIQITATQPGNNNYLPATAVTQTLTVTSSDATIHKLIVGNKTYPNPDPGSTITYHMDCASSATTVPVEVITETNAQVTPGHQFVIQTPKPGTYKQLITVVSEDGSHTKHYTVVVTKNFAFSAIVVQKFDNILLVNNNPATNGGYTFKSYKWYKNGKLIGTGQYYSAGDNANDKLSTTADYRVVVTTTNGEIIKTCIGHITLNSNLSAWVAPNPVQIGQTAHIYSNFPKGELEHMQISVYTLNGQLVRQVQTHKGHTAIPVDGLPAAVYLIKCKTPHYQKTFKMIIK